MQDNEIDREGKKSKKDDEIIDYSTMSRSEFRNLNYSLRKKGKLWAARDSLNNTSNARFTYARSKGHNGLFDEIYICLRTMERCEKELKRLQNE